MATGIPKKDILTPKTGQIRASHVIGTSSKIGLLERRMSVSTVFDGAFVTEIDGRIPGLLGALV